jgi:hypothetical protein
MSKILFEFVKAQQEPFPDATFGDGYRCSVYLKDGTFLPCVVLRQSRPTVDLAIRRFEQEKKGKGIFGFGQNGYEQIVRNFVLGGDRINSYDIARVESSKFAIPLALHRQIHGETTMSWTGFVLAMRNGQNFAFGTSFDTAFFDLPDQYSFDDVVAVHNHSYVDSLGNLGSLRQGIGEQPSDYDGTKVFMSRPYFVCYYDA